MKSNKLYRSIIELTVLVILLIIVWSCDRKDIVGPEIGIASSNFSITTPFSASTSNADFSSTPVTFSAQFNEKVTYTITITGEESGATKTITFLDDQIDPAEAIWDGSSNLIFFRTETCNVELTVLGKEEPVASLSIDILVTKTESGVLVASFEPANPNAVCGFFEEDALIACEKTDEIKMVEGDYGWKVAGIDLTGGQFIGLAFTSPVPGKNSTSGLYYDVTTTDPDSVWFNIYIYGKGDKNAGMYIKFMQDDNFDGQHTPNQENGFEYQIRDISHYGWKKFSVPYSSLTVSGNQLFGGSGDRVHRPYRIVQIEYSIWSWKKNQPVQAIFDYPVFTYGKAHHE